MQRAQGHSHGQGTRIHSMNPTTRISRNNATQSRSNASLGGNVASDTCSGGQSNGQSSGQSSCGGKVCGDKNNCRCYKVVTCENNCCEREFRRPCNPQCPIEEVFFKVQDAIVQIESSFTLTTDAGQLNPPLTGRQDILIKGNGFFIRKHYIVCPASLVLIPPSFLATNNRYPFVSITQPAPTGLIPNTMTKVSRILVTVFGVSCANDGVQGLLSYVYEADLVGVDGAGEVAILQINCAKTVNQCNPPIRSCHPFFKFGCSRDAAPGQKVYTLGGFQGSNVAPNHVTSRTTITAGTLGDSSHADYKGYALFESILVDFNVYAFGMGLPIIDACGQVLGMITGSVASTTYPTQDPLVVTPVRAYTQGKVFGPSERSMRPAINTIIGCKDSKMQNRYANIIDSLGSYIRYLKGYAGVGYNIVTGQTYFSTVQPDGTILLDYDVNGNLSQGPKMKSVIGIRVSALAGGVVPTNPAIPGAATAAPYTTPASGDSPFLSLLGYNDIIAFYSTCNKAYALGDLDKQYVPSLFTWTKVSGDSMMFTYYLKSENYSIPRTANINLIDFPFVMDYPWYNVQAIPTPTGVPYLGWPSQNFTPAF